MSFFQKLRIVGGLVPDVRHLRPGTGNGNGHAVAMRAGYVSPAAARSSESQETTRLSNGLKEFLWSLDGLGRGTLLDLGPASQATLSLFIERGFRVTSDDLLLTWKQFLDEERSRMKAADPGLLALDLTPEGRAARFLESNFKYSAASFDAVLVWDLLDYLEPALAKRIVSCLTDVLRPGGAMFAMFHSRKPEVFHRYRVVDSTMLQSLPAPVLCPAQKVYQNREIQDLFTRYRTTKSFVGRNQLREVLFLK